MRNFLLRVGLLVLLAGVNICFADGAESKCEKVCPPENIIIIDRNGQPVYIPKGALTPKNYYTPEQYQEALRQKYKEQRSKDGKLPYDPDQVPYDTNRMM